MIRDAHDDAAEKLLPLHEAKTTFKCKENQHVECYGIVQGESAGDWFMCVCNCHFRVAVAAALRQAGEIVSISAQGVARKSQRILKNERLKAEATRATVSYQRQLEESKNWHHLLLEERVKIAGETARLSQEIAALKAECDTLTEQIQNTDGSTWKELNDERLKAWNQYFTMKIERDAAFVRGLEAGKEDIHKARQRQCHGMCCDNCSCRGMKFGLDAIQARIDAAKERKP